MQDQSYLHVEKYDKTTNSWNIILRDNDWETEFEWIRTRKILGESEVEIRWFAPEDQEPGTYRYGIFKATLKKAQPPSNQFCRFLVDLDFSFLLKLNFQKSCVF